MPRIANPLPKPFKLDLRPIPVPGFGSVDRIRPEAKPQEQFAGELQGKSASDIEERFARACDKYGLSYDFRSVYGGLANRYGSAELDFAVYVTGLMYPFNIDGEFAHKSASQKEEDRVKDAILDDELNGQASAPVRRIPGMDLETQQQADAIVREYL